MYCNPSTDNVGFLDLPGVDYRGCQLYNKAAGHTVIILNFNTSKITVTDCNHEPLCKIRWFADYKTKSDVSVKGSYIISPVPIVVEDSYCNWNLYEVDSTSLIIRSGASTKTREVYKMPQGTRFYIDSSRQWVNSSNQTWGYCKTLNGYYGWGRLDVQYCSQIIDPSDAIVDSPIDEYVITYAGGSINMCSEPNTNCDIVQTMPRDTKIYVYRNTLVTKSDYTWGYAYTYQGDKTYGWVAIREEYMQRKQNLPFGDMIDLTDDQFTVGKQVTATCMDQNCGFTTWESSDTSVIQVYPWGEDQDFCTLEIVGLGTATITVAGKYVQTFTVDKDYFSICQNNGLRYPTGITVYTISKGRISSLPANPDVDEGKEYGSTYLSDELPIATALHVTEIIENHAPGHYWYHVQYEGIDGWFYSNYCAGNTGGIKIDTDSCLLYTGFSIPSSYAEGDEVDITGCISTEKARIRSVNLVINTNSGCAYNEKKVFDIPVSYVDLEDPEIAPLLHFSDLSAGEYTFGFAFDLWAPYVNSNHQLVTDWGIQFPAETMYSFEVVSTPIIDKTVTVPSGSMDAKLEALKEIFPDGWYWNHWTEDTIGDYRQYNYTIKYGRMPDGTPETADGSPVYCGISTRPCDSGNAGNSDNRYWGYLHGGRGLGFSRMIFDLLWDIDTETKSSIFVRRNSTFVDDAILDYLAVGDMVCISDGTTSITFVITGVSTEYVNGVACNLNPHFTSLSNSLTGCHCQIDWDITISRSLLETLAQDSSVKTFYVNIPEEERDLSDVELSFDVSEIVLFTGVPFTAPAGWGYLRVTPESIRDQIDYEQASSNTRVVITYSSGIWPNEPGTATVTVTYGSATASVKVKVLGRSDCMIIPNGTKTIAEEAFYDDSSIKAVVLPNGIKRIESKAFANCRNLMRIWLPDSLEYIASDAFDGCPQIQLCMLIEDPGIAETYAQQYGFNYDYYDP